MTPRGNANVIWRAFARVVSLEPVSVFFMNLATRVDRPLLRLSDGRLRLSFVVPMLLLTCRGARTGELREVPLLYVPDGENVLLIGSNGGKSYSPAWCHNLRHEPRVSCALKGRVRQFRAWELAGADREQAWKEAVAEYPGYERYVGRANRVIPLFRLVPEEPGV